MHKEDIKAAIRKQYGTLSAFEASKQLPCGSMKDVLRGRAVAQTEKAIADELNQPLHILFPTRYPAPVEAEPSTKVDNKHSDRDVHRLSARAG
jgi:lambda repressor-like predicted transcriptional regulator